MGSDSSTWSPDFHTLRSSVNCPLERSLPVNLPFTETEGSTAHAGIRSRSPNSVGCEAVTLNRKRVSNGYSDVCRSEILLLPRDHCTTEGTYRFTYRFCVSWKYALMP